MPLGDFHARTVDRLAERFGPIAELLVQDALERSGVKAGQLRSSRHFLRFLGALHDELPGNEDMRRDICERLWRELGDSFVFAVTRRVRGPSRR